MEDEQEIDLDQITDENLLQSLVCFCVHDFRFVLRSYLCSIFFYSAGPN